MRVYTPNNNKNTIKITIFFLQFQKQESRNDFLGER